MCDGTSTTTTTCVIASASVGFPGVLCWKELPPWPRIPVGQYKGCCWFCYCTAATTSISNRFSLPVATQVFAINVMGPPQEMFSLIFFQSWASHWYFCWYLLWWLLSLVNLWCGPTLLQQGPTFWAVALHTFGAYSWQAYMPPGVGSWAMQECTEYLLLHCLKLGCLMLLKQLFL